MIAAPDNAAPINTPPSRWLVANLVAQIAFGLLAMTICLPSMQEWGASFGASQASVQLSFSAYLIAYGLLQLVYGPLSDRLGRRRLLMVGLALAFTGSVLAALAPSLSALIAARILQGAGSAAGMVLGRATVQDLFQGPARTRVMAYIGMAMGLCPPLATVIGGQIHVRVGWQGNFVLVALLALGLLLAAWRGLPSLRQTAPADTHWLRDMAAAFARLGREPRFVFSVAVLCLTVATFYAFLAGAPIVLRSYGVGPDRVGWFIMVVPLSFIVGNFAASRATHRLGDRQLMRLGQAVTLAGVALMLALGLAGWSTALAFVLPLSLLGLGHGLLMPSCLAGSVGAIPALAGSAAAVAGVAQQLMGALGGYVVGWVPHEGSVNLGLVMLGFTLAAIAAQIALHRRRPVAREHPAPS